VNLIRKFYRRFQTGVASLKNDWQTLHLARAVAFRANGEKSQKPVIFFNASTRIRGFSLNAAYSLLASWAIRLQGVPVVHFVCQAGMSRCLLGTNQDDVNQSMPCRLCQRQSRVNFIASDTSIFTYQRDPALAAALADLDIQALMQYEHPFGDGKIPLGALVLPSIRWRMRCLTLTDEASTRFLYREFIQSAWNVAREFNALLDRLGPQAVVVFNGQFFPEATTRWLCLQRGIKVITHEVGFQPLAGYFTPGEAPAWPIHIPDTFELSEEQNARLDAYLEKRFQGRFSMAGIQFWPEMKGLGDAFLQKAAGFKQIVPIFTNVVFDTSQSYSNALFPDMFAWLEKVLESARRHQETLFVIRAHPDESRPGKASRESVAMWVEQSGATRLPNIIFVGPDEYISSYDLIRHSKFVMIYNSTIGLESSILGVPVLCAGSARFSDFGAVFFPASQKAYMKELENFLSAREVTIPPEHIRNSRRFFYFHYFITSLGFNEFLEPTALRGYVKWKKFTLGSISPSVSPTIRALVEGILHDGDFLLME
jgi:hypothetical protein